MIKRRSRYDLDAIGKEEYVPMNSFDHDKIHGALKPLDAIAADIELRWGNGRIETLVSVETAAKFEAARAKLDVAMHNQDADEVVRRATVMMRGWQAIETEAKELGHSPAPPDMWYATAPKENGEKELQIVIAKDNADASLAQTDVPVYNATEIARIVRAWRSQADVHTVKGLFKGAEVVKLRELEEDEVPF